MPRVGIEVNLNAEVSEVRRDGSRVTGLVANGTFHAADIIVSNMEVIPACQKLLREDKAFIASLEKKLEPTRFVPRRSSAALQLSACRSLVFNVISALGDSL